LVEETKEVGALPEAMATGRARVLVVEDDAGIAEAVVYALGREGMDATAVHSLEAARAFAEPIHLAVLDLGLPDGSGFALLREWCSRIGSGPAVIVLTSREGEVDCIASLEAGADDFMTKPFSPRELAARARAALRRGVHVAARGTPDAGGIARATAPALAIDGERRTATYAGRSLELTKTEFDLLAALANVAGRVLSRDQLVARVWGDGHALTERTIDTHVKALRRKLAEAGAGPSLIVAVRGVGFKLREAT
jgi:two-component system catabolic regulation response regulator CreB